MSHTSNNIQKKEIPENVLALGANYKQKINRASRYPEYEAKPAEVIKVKNGKILDKSVKTVVVTSEPHAKKNQAFLLYATACEKAGLNPTAIIGSIPVHYRY